MIILRRQQFGTLEKTFRPSLQIFKPVALARAQLGSNPIDVPGAGGRRSRFTFPFPLRRLQFPIERQDVENFLIHRFAQFPKIPQLLSLGLLECGPRIRRPCTFENWLGNFTLGRHRVAVGQRGDQRIGFNVQILKRKLTLSAPPKFVLKTK